MCTLHSISFLFRFRFPYQSNINPSDFQLDTSGCQDWQAGNCLEGVLVREGLIQFHLKMLGKILKSEKGFLVHFHLHIFEHFQVMPVQFRALGSCATKVEVTDITSSWQDAQFAKLISELKRNKLYSLIALSAVPFTSLEMISIIIIIIICCALVFLVKRSKRLKRRVPSNRIARATVTNTHFDAGDNEVVGNWHCLQWLLTLTMGLVMMTALKGADVPECRRKKETANPW